MRKTQGNLWKETIRDEIFNIMRSAVKRGLVNNSGDIALRVFISLLMDDSKYRFEATETDDKVTITIKDLIEVEIDKEKILIKIPSEKANEEIKEERSGGEVGKAPKGEWFDLPS